jgi:pimeloyl-ACP methyl ester carboxylesterase
MAASVDGAPSSSELLYHISVNDDKQETIVLLHGLNTSHREWARISPDLSSYHLLIPDLPRHRSSPDRSCDDHGPYTLSNASAKVADLIRAHAHNGKAHVVGYSGGGFVGVALTNNYPELVQSLFVTGVYNMESRRRLFTVAQYLAVPVQTIQNALPMSVLRYLTDLEELPESWVEDGKLNSSFKLGKEGFAAMLTLGEGYPLKVRSLVVAGTKHDDVEGTRKLGEMFKRGNGDSRAVKIEGGMHAWGIKWPDIFAEAVKAWIERRDLPGKLEPLE